MAIGELSTLEIVFISLAVVALAVAAATWAWLNRNRQPQPEKQHEGHDFIGRWIIYSTFAAAFFIVLWLVGFLDRNTALLLIVVIFVGIGFLYWRALKGLQRPSMDEIREKYALLTIHEKYPFLRKYQGRGDWDSLIWEKRVPSPIPGDPFRVVDVFLLQLEDAMYGSVVPILLKFDPQKLTSTFCFKNPGQMIIYQELSKDDAESAWTTLQEYERASQETEAKV